MSKKSITALLTAALLTAPFSTSAYATPAVGTNGVVDINTNFRSGAYFLEDLTRHMYTTNGGIIQTLSYRGGYTTAYPMTDADNLWYASGQQAGVYAHFNMGIVYDYLRQQLGWNSYNNAGGTLTAVVNYGRYNNAATWDGTKLIFGDGDNVIWRSPSHSLDLVAHGIYQGVIDWTAGLDNTGDAGSLRLSFGDAFAVTVDDGDWTIGEDAYTPNTAGDAARYLYNPPLGGQVAHMNDYQVLPDQPEEAMAMNAGIPNKAYYLFAHNIGNRNQAQRVWHLALRDYMTSTPTLKDARDATLQACLALYGPGSLQYAELQSAWYLVGL